jgi:bla regulator protein BlaR1
MIPAELRPLANHLWQSTLFVGVVALLTLALRKNRAAVRYWLWLAASVKFLIPFSLLIEVGSLIQWRSQPVISQPQISFAMEQIARPLAILAPAPVNTAAPGALPALPAILYCLWSFGCAFAAVSWIRSWWRIRAVRCAASPVDLKLTIPAFSTSARMEPGVFGITKPVLLLPAGITGRLTPGQLEAVLAHELCHVRRRDNLTAAVHTLVEILCWFHPLVWWIGARLIEEREHACDEAVVESAGDAQAYAEGILNVCRLYLESPLACVSGVAGSNLRRRIESVLNWYPPRELNFWKKVLLGVAGLAAVAGPLAVGAANAPSFAAQSRLAAAAPRSENLSADQRADVGAPAQTASSSGPTFEVASVRRTDVCGGRNSIDDRYVTLRGVPLKPVLMEAFRVKVEQIAGPSWLETGCFDISAKMPDGATRDQLPEMLQALLAERFKLAAHQEDRLRSGYVLVVDKGGPKFKENDPKADFMGSRAGQTLYGAFGHGRLKGVMTMATLAANLSRQGYGPVQDLTGLTGKYGIDLTWTPDKAFEPRPVEATASAATPPGADIPAPEANLFAALRESLGLKLERRDVQVHFVVIDHIERIPTEN